MATDVKKKDPFGFPENEEPKKAKQDNELAVMSRITRQLLKLPEEERNRIGQWLASRFGPK